MKNQIKKLNNHAEVLVLGSGMGSLTAAALLANSGRQVTVIEQNYLPGGCSSSYFRQGFVFESGATTLVGLDKGMPLRYLLDKTGICLDSKKLEKPMLVQLKTGETLTRHQDLDAWIAEAESVFGPVGQRPFWEHCYKVSKFVWNSSLSQLSFPPSSFKDLGPMLAGFQFKQLAFANYAFMSMEQLLKKFGLLHNEKFIDFVNEQLLITAQNTISAVNVLFGATALCYTNYDNSYVYGGMIQMINPIIDFIKSNKGEIRLRCGAQKISYQQKKYWVETNEGTISADYLISGIPINNLLEIWTDEKLQRKYKNRILTSPQLNSAFQMGIGFERAGNQPLTALHHQVHLAKPLAQIGSKSIFLSLSDPIDWYRAPLGQAVASVSTHIPNPEVNRIRDKEELEQIIIETLHQKRLIDKASINYYHASGAMSW